MHATPTARVDRPRVSLEMAAGVHNAVGDHASILRWLLLDREENTPTGWRARQARWKARGSRRTTSGSSGAWIAHLARAGRAGVAPWAGYPMPTTLSSVHDRLKGPPNKWRDGHEPIRPSDS
jgi:hypothetical protein